MEVTLLKFQEKYSAKTPALTLLHKLGWKFFSPEQALVVRESRSRNLSSHDISTSMYVDHFPHPASHDISTSMYVTSEISLRDVLRKFHFTYAGKERLFSESSIDNVISKLCSSSLNKGLNVVNEKIYNHLLSPPYSSVSGAWGRDVEEAVVRFFRTTVLDRKRCKLVRQSLLKYLIFRFPCWKTG